MTDQRKPLEPALAERVRHWLEADPDPATQATLRRAWEAADEEVLRQWFDVPLRFGTAGLRGAVGPGPACMNRAVVRRVAWALGCFLREEKLGDRPVVVGFDARPTSEGFARDTVGVLAAQGLEVLLVPEPCPTPWIAFACRALSAAAGVMVTASHNPRGDNGYKVYDDRGIQIVAPWDERIAALMDEAPAAHRIPFVAEGGRPVPSRIIDDYFAPWQTERRQSSSQSPPLRVAYTPLHGVGLASLRRALGERAELMLVSEQADPDGTFPTVEFPNPEEPGVLNAVLALAERENCDLALANDPDADRLAVGIVEEGVWRRLSGDEVGVLLADELLARRRREPNAAEGRVPVVGASVVSTPLIDEIVAERGGRVERTLTGFKWLCRVPEHLGPSEEFVFAYEEALGYAVDPRVLDKDGISAAVCFVELTEALRSRGVSVAEHLRSLYERYGLWVSAPWNVRLEGADAAERMRRALDRLRQERPSVVGGQAVLEVVDYLEGVERRPAYLGRQDLLELKLGPTDDGDVERGKVLIRPSGTEPKLKIYVHLCGSLAPSGSDGAARLREARARLEERGQRVARELCAFLGLD